MNDSKKPQEQLIEEQLQQVNGGAAIAKETVNTTPEGTLTPGDRLYR